MKSNCCNMKWPKNTIRTGPGGTNLDERWKYIMHIMKTKRRNARPVVNTSMVRAGSKNVRW